MDGGQLPSPREGLRATLVNDVLFVTGGWDNYLDPLLGLTEQILVNKSDKSDHPHQREPWCFVEVVNKVGAEAMPTNF